jgi:hypothetical protein
LRCPNCHYFTETYKTKNWSTQNNESAEWMGANSAKC